MFREYQTAAIISDSRSIDAHRAIRQLAIDLTREVSSFKRRFLVRAARERSPSAETAFTALVAARLTRCDRFARDAERAMNDQRISGYLGPERVRRILSQCEGKLRDAFSRMISRRY